MNNDEIKKHLSHAEYDEESQSFIFHSKYDFDVIKTKFIKHFENGGLPKKSVLAGLAQVSRQTMSAWLTHSNKSYKRELAALVDQYKCVAHLRTDEMHLAASNGENKDANAACLNRRAEYFLGLTKQIEIKAKENEPETLDELDAELEALKEKELELLAK